MIELIVMYVTFAGILTTIYLFVDMDSTSMRSDAKYLMQELIVCMIVGMSFGWFILPAELVVIIKNL